MVKFNTFEITIFTICIFLMVLAVWMLQTQTQLLTVQQVNNQQAAVSSGLVAVDSSNADRASALRAAVSESVDSRGAVTRLIVDDIDIGSGPAVEVGDRVTVHYVGTLPNGQEFDSSYTRGVPFTFTVGQGRVITGWEEGLVGMQAGGKRILVIPPDKAYGPRGHGPIPGNATLVFAIELLEIN